MHRANSCDKRRLSIFKTTSNFSSHFRDMTGKPKFPENVMYITTSEATLKMLNFLGKNLKAVYFKRE